MDSVEEEAAVDADLSAEAALGHVAGPYDTPPFPFYRCSPLKTVPKKGSAARFRIIDHLSHPHGRSINSSTADWPCVLAGFSTAVRMVRKLGRGCYLAKLDVKAAYRCIPVRPADWPLLGMQWKGRYLFHKTLPFGLRSSCHLWERYATALEWVIRAVFAVQNITHYVDDTCIGNVTLSGCTRDLAQATAAMDELGVPVAQDKTEGPTTSLVYLGIRIDTVEMSISLDRARVLSILAIVADLAGRRTCSLRRLQSTLGTLQWALRSCSMAAPSSSTSVTSPSTTGIRADLTTRALSRSLTRRAETSGGGRTTSLSGTASACCGRRSGWTARPSYNPTPTRAWTATPACAAPSGFMGSGAHSRSSWPAMGV